MPNTYNITLDRPSNSYTVTVNRSVKAINVTVDRPTRVINATVTRNGPRGRGWLSGNGIPLDSIGSNGDLYADLTNGVYYGPKTNNTWAGAGPRSYAGGGGGGTTDWASVTNKPASFPPDSHAHPISQVVNLQTELNAKGSASDVSANTAARHSRNEDVKLDEGGANETTASELRGHLDDADKHREINDAGNGITDLWSASKIASEIGNASALTTGNLSVFRLPLLASSTANSNNTPGLLHTPGSGVTSANIVLAGVLGLPFWIDLSQGPSSCDITLVGAPTNSEIITYPGGVATVGTVHTFDSNDRGRYRYFTELSGGIWKLHVIQERKTIVEQIQYNLEAAGTGSHTATTEVSEIPFIVPEKLNGLRLSNLVITIQGSGVGGTEDYIMRRERGGSPTFVATLDVASGATETGNLIIATASSEDIVQTGDHIYFERDTVHSTTAATGYTITQMTFIEK